MTASASHPICEPGPPRRADRRTTPPRRPPLTRGSGSASPARGRGWRSPARRPAWARRWRGARPAPAPATARSRRRPRSRSCSRAGTRASLPLEVAPDVVAGEHADDRDDPSERSGDGERDQRQVQAVDQQVAQPDPEAEGERVGEDPLAVADRDVRRRAPEGRQRRPAPEPASEAARWRRREGRRLPRQGAIQASTRGRAEDHRPRQQHRPEERAVLRAPPRPDDREGAPREQCGRLDPLACPPEGPRDWRARRWRAGRPASGAS